MGYFCGTARPVSLAVTLLATSLMVACGVHPASASGHVTSINEWQTIAPGGTQLGLGADSEGNLLSFAQTGQLVRYDKGQLTTAMAGVPTSSASQRLAFLNATGRNLAGIVTATNGNVYFDTGSSNTIWALTTSRHSPTPLAIATNSTTRFSGLEISPDQQYLYAADRHLGLVYRISLTTMRVNVVFDSSGDRLEQLAIDSAGNLYVAGQSGAVYAVAARSLEGPNSGIATTRNHGASVVAYLGTNANPGGLAIDGADDVYVATCSSVSAPHAVISVITTSAISAAHERGEPATQLNGGVPPIATTWSEPAFGCIGPLAVSEGVLYASDWRNGKIWGLALRDLGTLVRLAPAATGTVQLTRTSSTLLAMWPIVPSAFDYVCTLMDSSTVPSNIHETTVSNACWFGGLSPTQQFGVRVSAINLSGASSVGYAPAPPMATITCSRGTTIRRVESYAPRCPAGYSRVR